MESGVIGIFGDSFANCSDKFGGWPKDLGELVNLPVTNHSKPGTSLWFSYKLFLENYKNYSHIVFSYTNPHRWASLPDELVGYSWLTKKENIDIALILSDYGRKQMTTLLESHKILFDPELDIFLYQHIFNQVNKICKENNIKIYNVLPFEFIDMDQRKHQFMSWYTGRDTERLEQEYLIDFSGRHGPCLVNLCEISFHEMRQQDKIPKLQYITTVSDVRGCHMNITNNRIVATILAENWEADNNEIINTFVDTRLSYDPQELIEMIETHEFTE